MVETRPRRRALRLLFRILLSFVVLEGTLRIAGGVYLFLHARAPSGSGPRTILCVGDSNTFGLWMDAAGPYPAQLAALLEARAPGAYGVVNLGVPGINTWTLLAHLPEDLDRHEPEAVVLLAGLNDRWGSPPEGIRADSAFDRLRIVRLVRLLSNRLRESPSPEAPAPGEGEVIAATMRDGETRPFVVSGKPLSEDEAALRRRVHEDFAAAARLVESRGAVPILSTYGADRDPYGPVNEGIREAAAEVGSSLVDAARAFRSGGPDIERTRLLLPDDHPDREGYGVLARLVLNELVEAGVVPGPPIADPFEAMRDRPRPSPRLRWVSDAGADPILEAEFLPEFDCKVLFSRSAAKGTKLWGFPVPLDRDELFERTGALDALRVPFDETGRARIPIPPEAGEAIGDREAVVGAVAVRWGLWPGHPPEELARHPIPDFLYAYVAGCSEPLAVRLR